MLFFNKIGEEISSIFTLWNGLDYGIALVAIGCTVFGIIRGFKSAVLPFFKHIAAFIVASRYYMDLIPWVKKRVFSLAGSGLTLQPLTGGEGAAGSLSLLGVMHATVAFLLLFSFVWIGLWLMQFSGRKLPNCRPVWAIERVAGTAIGFVQFLFLWCIICALLRAWPVGTLPKWVVTSSWVNKTGELILDVMVEEVKWQR